MTNKSFAPTTPVVNGQKKIVKAASLLPRLQPFNLPWHTVNTVYPHFNAPADQESMHFALFYFQNSCSDTCINDPTLFANTRETCIKCHLKVLSRMFSDEYLMLVFTMLEH